MKKREKAFTFEKNKTFFGLDVYRYGIKKRDIEKLPFYEFWNESAEGSTCAVVDDEIFVYIHDWERFCQSFILHGSHRFQMPEKVK